MQTTGEKCWCEVAGCPKNDPTRRGVRCLQARGWTQNEHGDWLAPADLVGEAGPRHSYDAAVLRTNAWLRDQLAEAERAVGPEAAALARALRNEPPLEADVETTQEMPAVTVQAPGEMVAASEDELRAWLDAHGRPGGAPPGQHRFHVVEWQGLFFVAHGEGPRSAVRHAPLVLADEAKLLRAAEAEESLRSILEQVRDDLEQLQDLADQVQNRDFDAVDVFGGVDTLLAKVRKALDEIEVSDAALELIERRVRARPGG